MVRDVVHGIRVAETSNLQIGVRSIFDGQYHTQESARAIASSKVIRQTQAAGRAES